MFIYNYFSKKYSNDGNGCRTTTDEYLYAMKEDLADWLSNMYPEWRPITADNFLECLGKNFDIYFLFYYLIIMTDNKALV